MLAPTVIVIPDAPVPGAEIVCGLKLTVVPDGTPEAESEIELLKPPLAVVAIPDAPPFPCTIVREDGVAEIVKVGSCTPTVNVTVVFC